MQNPAVEYSSFLKVFQNRYLAVGYSIGNGEVDSSILSGSTIPPTSHGSSTAARVTYSDNGSLGDFNPASAPPTTKRHAAGDADAEHVDPALVKIEQMRVEGRTDEVLHDDDMPGPGHQSFATKQQEMAEPHSVQHDGAEQPPLHQDIEGLIVRVADYLGGQPALSNGVPFEQSPDRTGAVAEQRGVGKEPDRFAPIGKALCG